MDKTRFEFPAQMRVTSWHKDPIQNGAGVQGPSEQRP